MSTTPRTTGRTCAHCGKWLKPLPGNSPLGVLNLPLVAQRNGVCRSCGRRQPPLETWGDFILDFKKERKAKWLDFWPHDENRLPVGPRV